MFGFVRTLAVSNLRAQHAPFITATDASTGWLAAVRADAPQAVVAEVSRRGLRKGRWAKLLPPRQARRRANGSLAPEDELPAESFDARSLWVLLARTLVLKNGGGNRCSGLSTSTSWS